MLLYTKAGLHLYINSFHHVYLNYFFRYVTHIGDGIFIAALILLLVFIRYRYALLLACSYLLSSLITQFLKKFIFHDFERPKKFFEDVAGLYYVPGVELHSFNSFPSGHATTAFALFFCLALIVQQHSLKLICFIMALTVTFSRLYLSQHFFIDIYFGSLIGIASTLLIYYFIQTSKKLNQSQWIDKSLLNTVFKSK